MRKTFRAPHPSYRGWRGLADARRGVDVELVTTWGRGVSLVGRGFLLLSVTASTLAGASGQSDPMAVPARQWAADAARNELKSLEYDHDFMRYRMHLVDAKGDVVRDVIESRDGPVARLILKNSRALTAEEDAAERERLQAMLDSPAAYARHVKNESNGKKQAGEMLRALPVAMLYSYAPGQPQREHRAGNAAQEIVVDYKPDPGWTPPGMVAEALTGLEGRVWIDPPTHTMTRLETRVFRGVNVGLGLLAHIYPGGNAQFEQIRVSDDRWIFTHFVAHLTVRALMVKTIKQDSEVQGSNFSPVSKMTYQDAIRLLLATPLPAR